MTAFFSGTRAYNIAPATLSSHFSTMLNAGAVHAFAAIKADEDPTHLLEYDWAADFGDSVTVIPTSPWGFFVPALNSLLVAGRNFLAKDAQFLIASVEIVVDRNGVRQMQGHLDEDTLAVGAALEGHQYEPGQTFSHANGVTTPWNTCMLYAPRIWMTGVPMLGDGLVGDPTTKGVEEVITFAFYQKLFGADRNQVKMTQVPGQKWDVGNLDATRLAAHQKKMASKVARPAAQLTAAGMKGPEVQHI